MLKSLKMLSFPNTQSWQHVIQKHKTEHIYTHPFIFKAKHRYKKNENRREYEIHSK